MGLAQMVYTKEIQICNLNELVFTTTKGKVKSLMMEKTKLL